jgi:outer membrane immunogenic protein
MDWFGTLRTRAGLAANNTFVYITGGVAVADIETTFTDPPDTFNFGKTRWGVVGGAGAEVDLGNNWSVNGEVLYMQFAKHTATGVDGGATAFRFDMNDSAWVGRLGLNYRFSSAAPVMSKY